jgi:nucleoid-associated protein YgaU
LQAQKTTELLAKPPVTTTPKEEVKIEIPATTLKPPEQSKLLEAPKPLVAPKPLEPSPAPVAPEATPQPQPQNDIEGSEPLLRGFSTPATPKTTPRQNDKVRTYVVQPGDTLYRISEKCYNDPNQWKKIREANSTRIGVDDRVRAGQILIIP